LSANKDRLNNKDISNIWCNCPNLSFFCK
jgi:hypothetical protein